MIYAPLFEKCYELLPNGNYAIDDASTWLLHFADAGLVNTARRKGEVFNETHKNIAAGLQSMLEKIALHVVTYFQRVTGIMAGKKDSFKRLGSRIAGNLISKEDLPDPYPRLLRV